MTLSVTADLYEIVKKHNEIKCIEIARRAMWKYARKLELLDRLTEKSKLTEKDVMEIDQTIKKSLAKHYMGQRE